MLLQRLELEESCIGTTDLSKDETRDLNYYRLQVTQCRACNAGHAMIQKLLVVPAACPIKPPSSHSHPQTSAQVVLILPQPAHLLACCVPLHAAELYLRVPGRMQGSTRLMVLREDVAAAQQVADAASAEQHEGHAKRMQQHQQVCQTPDNAA